MTVRQAARATGTAWVAFGWVVAFLAAHVYWYAGGQLGRAGDLPPLVPGSVGGWVFEIGVVAAFPVGAAACLAVARARGVPRRIAAVVVWTGAVVLAVRGGAGLVDDLLRAGGAAGGLTGMSIADVTGTTRPSAAELWSGRATDAYFTVGAALFALLGFRSRTGQPTRATPP